MTSHTLPVLHTVDVLIYGSTSSAIAAAVGAHASGASVVVISDRSNFGSESAGTLEILKDPSACAAALACIGEEETAGAGALLPGRFKHALEKALVRRGVPFLFLARPVALIPGAGGQMIGAVVAARTSLYAIEAKTFIDTSAEGLLGHLAETAKTGALPTLPPTPRPALAVLSRKPEISGAERFAEEPLPGLADQPLYLHRYPGSASPESPLAARAAWEGNMRVQAFDPSIVLHAESLIVSSGGLIEALGKARVEGEHAAASCAGIAYEPLPESSEPATTAGFVSSFHRTAERLVRLKLPVFPLIGSADVVVAGGGTGGAPAGIAAARAGASTVVLEIQRSLGGVGTLGTISSYWFGNRVGFTHEMDTALEQSDPTFGGTGKASMWNPELKAAWYLQELIEAGGAVWFGSFAFGVEKESESISGLLISTPWGAGLLKAGAVVDATGSADVAAAAGAPCRSIDARHVAVQGAGLSPRQPPRNYINSDFTFVDDDDVEGVTHAFVQARARFIDEFDVVPIVNTRERRQIIGAFELSPLDILAKRSFPDTITVARSNFDTHGYTVHPVFMVASSEHKPLEAEVPYRCLLPQKVDGVLVTGLGMSAHRDALPVIRMQADVQNQGYAAGYAASLAVRSACTLRDLPIEKLSSHLRQIGILPEQADERESRFPLDRSEIEAAARHTPMDFHHAAILFAHPEEAKQALRTAIAEASSDAQREEALAILGLLGDADAAAGLAKIVGETPWDNGWNYRGMGQFGFSSSRVDKLVVALARTGSPLAIAPIRAKIDELIASEGSAAAFSHCRAVAVAAMMLNDPRLTEALQRLIALPGLRGHAMLDTAAVIAAEPPAGPGALEKDWPANRVALHENSPRSHGLRELYLAKALYLCQADGEGEGEAILRQYASDLRGPFARHAQAILAESDHERLRHETV